MIGEAKSEPLASLSVNSRSLSRLLVATIVAFSAVAVTPLAGAEGRASVPEGPRQVTFVNHMDETIWVAATPGNAPAPLTKTGWRLPAGGQLTITVPNHWNGRFWGRTGCHFNAAGKGSCQTGDCNHEFQCQGYGNIPATLAEYNLDAWDNLDFYDVSMVDGSNLPMYINRLAAAGKDPISANGCAAAGCTKAVVCPHVLQVRVGGAVVGCISACCSLRDRPVLLPGQVVEPVGLQPEALAGGLRSRSSRGPSRSPIRTSMTTLRACSPATATATTGSRSV